VLRTQKIGSLKLIKAAENGERVAILRHGKPLVDLVRTASAQPGKREFGALRGQVIEIDPDWWKPMTDEEADDFLEGRY